MTVRYSVLRQWGVQLDELDQGPQPIAAEDGGMDVDHDHGQSVMMVSLKSSTICEIAVAVNGDTSEIQRSLCQPILPGSSGLDQEISQEVLKIAMYQGHESMRSFDVFTEIPFEQLIESEKKGIIDSRWVHRRKPDGSVMSRLVCRGSNEVIESRDGVYAATPTFSTFKLILSHALNNSHSMCVGDVSPAFLHAKM